MIENKNIRKCGYITEITEIANLWNILALLWTKLIKHIKI